MSLSKPGDGLYGTHVTWEDIQEEVRNTFGEKAMFGENKSVKLIAEGEGYVSRMCLITSDFEDPELPQQFVVKICTPLPMINIASKLYEDKGLSSSFSDINRHESICEQTRKLHNSEVSVYQRMSEKSISNIKKPKILFVKKYSEENSLKGYIGMEYIKGKNEPIYKNVTVDAMKQALSSLASLVSLSLDFTEKDKSELHDDIFGELYGPLVLSQSFDETWQEWKNLCGHGKDDLFDQLMDTLPDVLQVETVDNLAGQLDMTPVLVHGDLWSNNLIWSKDEDDNYVLEAMIDYQTAHMGCPAVDLTRLFASSMSGKDRRKNYKSLLQYFYQELENNVKKTDNKMPFSYEQLEESYQRYFPWCAYTIAANLAFSIHELLEEQVPEKEEQAFRIMMLNTREIVKEKLLALLEDLLEYHKAIHKSDA